MNDKINQQIREVCSDYDAAHPYSQQERRDREIQEAQQAEARAHKAAQQRQLEQRNLRQRVDANNSKAWCDWVDQRIAAHFEAEREPLVGAFGQVIAEERQKNRKETAAAVADATRALQNKINDLETRLRSVPGKLPVARVWQPESVTYQGEFICHEGATFQAKKDTAQKPGGGDWICVARAGRDAITPRVCGTYNVHEEYKMFDIVALDGASFIAIRDNPTERQLPKPCR